MERQAGIDPDFFVEAHGSFNTAHCIDCGHEYSHEYVKSEEEGQQSR